MTRCACGCQQPVKPGHRYASLPCWRKSSELAARATAWGAKGGKAFRGTQPRMKRVKSAQVSG